MGIGLKRETIVPYGVPQGSNLGPALFIVYANDLLFLMEKINGCHIEMYADDTVLYTSNASPVGAMSDMTNYVTILNKRCILNKLTHSRRALFRVFDSEFGQIEDILGIILVKKKFKKSN